MRPSLSISSIIGILGILGGALAVGCSTSPQPKLITYMGVGPTQAVSKRSELLPSPGKSFEVGLVVINDITGGDSAPPLSANALSFLTDRVHRQLEKSLPIKVAKVLPSAGIIPGRNPDQFVRLAADFGVDYLVLAIFSSAESEVPTRLPLTGDPEQGGGRPNVLGFEARNYALVELALVDAKTGQALVQANGRAWSRLNRLNVPVKSNSYPVIHRSLRTAPIYPNEENAKDLLRSIAGDEAMEQAVMHLQETWGRKVP